MKKILVVEDDKFLANAYRVKLTKSHFEVKVANDGDEAIRALSEFIPDLIILDLVMPKRDGFSVLSELKKNSEWRNIAVVVLSNLGQKEDIEKAKKLGADSYYIKTDLSMNNLIDKIGEVMEKRSS